MAEMSVMESVMRVPEARYAYYRRCQIFRKGGAQCKAPAEKGAHICYAHAGQLAMAVRRERELRAVLEAAVAQMRKRGRPECEMADLFMDFKGINMTLAVMSQAVIDGRIDCKTAGRLVVQLQTFSKLLWQIHRTKTKNLPLINTDATDLKKSAEEARLPQIYADEHRLERPEKKPKLTTEARRHGGKQNRLPLINADDTDLKKPNLTVERRGRGGKPSGGVWAVNHLPANHWATNQREEKRIALVAKVLAFANTRDWAHAPPELLRAA